MKKNFPFRETYTDYSGRQISFLIENTEIQIEGYLIRAVEEGKEYGYEFEAYSPVSPYLAAGEVRNKIRQGLSTCYLREENDRFDLTHQKAKGRIAHEGLVINGKHVPFKDFAKILTTYEGFNINIEITEPDA